MKTRLLTSIVSLFILCTFNSCSECDVCELTENNSKKLDTIMADMDKFQKNTYDRMIEIIGTDNFKNEDAELFLSLDCTKKEPQLLHVDLKYKFALQTEIRLDKNQKIDSVKVLLREIKDEKGYSENNYDLLYAKYIGLDTIAGKPYHQIEVRVNKSKVTTAEKYKYVENIKGLYLKKGELIDIHIKSDTIPEIKPLTDFGQHFCKTVVTEP